MQLPHLHLESYKGMLHMAVFFIAMLKVHVIERKLYLLEKRFMNK